MKTPYVKSGKVGNRVWSRNRYGQICYERFIPANPRTPKQMAVRQVWGVIAALWRRLTDEQRAQWKAAGHKQRSRKRMGRSSPLTGFHCFMRLNMLRASRGEAWVEVPPAEGVGAGEGRGVERWSGGEACCYGVATVLVRCGNGILSAPLRSLEGAGTVSGAGWEGLAAGIQGPFQPSLRDLMPLDVGSQR